MSLLSKVLRPAEAEVVDKLCKLFSEGIADMDDIWGEKPTLHRGWILFEQRRNKIIPVVELYFVLGGRYRHGIYYKASVMQEFPGRYSYEHATVPYCLTPSTWRKTAEKRLIEVLRTLIVEHSDEIPPRVSKLLVKEGPRSLHVLCRFLGHKVPSLALELTPAVEGSGLPEGFGGPASNVCSVQPASKISYMMWLLVPPNDVVSCTQAWELVFPNITEDVLRQEDCEQILQAALLLSWLGVKHDWDKMGLHNNFSVFQTLALNLATSKESFPTRSFRDQLKMMIDLLLESIKTSSLQNFYVPAMNYLAGITEDQKESITQKLREISENIDNDETLHEICRGYPLLLQDSLPRDSESFSEDSCGEADSETSSTSDQLVQGVEMDEGGGGERVFELESPPPLDVKDMQVPESTGPGKVLTGDGASDLGSDTLTRRTSRIEWGAYFEEQMTSCLISIILLAAVIIFMLPTFVGQFDGLGSYFNGDNEMPHDEEEEQDSEEPEAEQSDDSPAPLFEPDDEVL